MHYFPLSLPFLLLLLFLFIFLVTLVEVGILSYAYQRIGINQRYVFSLMLFSLLGSYINIPIFELPPEQVISNSYVDLFGIRHIIPHVQEWPGTVVAVNVGGALVPFFLSIYLTVKNKLYGLAFVGVGIVTFLVHQLAYPVKGVGIAVPFFTPPLASAIVGLVISRKYAPALAYISGSMGTLLGADITNIDKIRGLGAPIASIGGAGTFDGVFLTGIIAVLLAGFWSSRDRGTSLAP
ncbi:DUF1614 domain-containing protein [Desulforhabdus amnigena]|uniref:DUF1614 domain-containing protein n=1 Tax=Desulforhabdus amnigena TaxID=40218 RepID=UPI002490C801|nr:DUF1614 domain-containing protein [Desulforhabdus amnigena]